jgi:hypothetical protein
MGRAKTQAKRRGGRKPIGSKPSPAHAGGVSKFSGTETRDPRGGPKGPSDPSARKVEW